MSEQPQQDQLTDHAYDGIQEYDNPLPGWWTMIFWATIGFSALYLLVAFVAGPHMSAAGAYEEAVLEQMKHSGAPLKADAPTLLKLMKDPDSLQTGTAIFQANCIACHNREGQGLIGPNLTDDYYINVNKIEDIPDVVTKGRKNGAMPSWANRLSPNEIVQVSAYVASLRGRNLPSGNPALEATKGKLIPPWPTN
jgi:cytochrome c oxidase cbb3-type subunit 3